MYERYRFSVHYTYMCVLLLCFTLFSCIRRFFSNFCFCLHNTYSIVIHSCRNFFDHYLVCSFLCQRMQCFIVILFITTKKRKNDNSFCNNTFITGHAKLNTKMPIFSCNEYPPLLILVTNDCVSRSRLINVFLLCTNEFAC